MRRRQRELLLRLPQSRLHDIGVVLRSDVDFFFKRGEVQACATIIARLRRRIANNLLKVAVHRLRPSSLVRGILTSSALPPGKLRVSTAKNKAIESGAGIGQTSTPSAINCLAASQLGDSPRLTSMHPQPRRPHLHNHMRLAPHIRERDQHRRIPRCALIELGRVCRQLRERGGWRWEEAGADPRQVGAGECDGGRFEVCRGSRGWVGGEGGGEGWGDRGIGGGTGGCE